MSQKSFTDEFFLRNSFYNLESKLNKRIDIWNRFGTNRIKYKDYIMSILGDEYSSYADLGCGNAMISLHIAERVKNVSYFVDISPAMIDAAKQHVFDNLGSYQCSNVFLNESFYNTSITSNSCDLVTAMHSIQHAADINRVFNEIERITKASGTVLITTYDKSLTDWINITHYSLLKELGFPNDMLEKELYLAFSGTNAKECIGHFFGEYESYTYENDALVTSVKDLLAYYASGMMFRAVNSNVNDVTDTMWQKLLTRMEEEIEKEMQQKGKIRIEGKVLCAKIKM